MVERLGERTQEVAERDARLSRQFRHPRHHQGGRGHHAARPAVRPLPGCARRPHPDAQRRARRARHRTSPRRWPKAARKSSARSTSASATSPPSSTCAAPSSPTRSAPRSTTSTRRSASARMEVANNLDTRIGRFEELLVGRAETVTKEIETRSKAAADMLGARAEQLSEVDQDPHRRGRALDLRARPPRRPSHRHAPRAAAAMRSRPVTTEAERSISGLATSTTDRDRRPAASS